MTTSRWRLSRDGLIALALVLIVWTALAWFFAFQMAGGYVCSILQPVAVAGQATPAPMPDTPEEWDVYMRDHCGLHNGGALLFFGAGYVVIGAVAIRSARLAATDDDLAM
jgi:hypothetical protein